MSVQCLTAEQKVQVVKMVVEDKMTKVAVSKKFNVSTDTIRRVVKEAERINQSIANATNVMAKSQEDVEHLENVIAQEEKPEVQKGWCANSRFMSITIGTDTYNADNTHESFQAALQKLVDGDIDGALELINVKVGLEKYVKGHVHIEHGVLKYKDLIIDSGLTKRIIAKMHAGEDFDDLLMFFENLMMNPSRSAVYRLYDFLEHNDIQITKDGYFIAWKRVNANYTDMYTGKMDNTPGVRVEVDRNFVDEDADRTCSHGLHVAARSYIPHYGGGRGVIIACKVHPRDVVAIPKDYNNAKMRCCGYDVLEDVTATFHETKFY